MKEDHKWTCGCIDAWFCNIDFTILNSPGNSLVQTIASRTQNWECGLGNNTPLAGSYRPYPCVDTPRFGLMSLWTHHSQHRTLNIPCWTDLHECCQFWSSELVKTIWIKWSEVKHSETLTLLVPFHKVRHGAKHVDVSQLYLIRYVMAWLINVFDELFGFDCLSKLLTQIYLCFLSCWQNWLPVSNSLHFPAASQCWGYLCIPWSGICWSRHQELMQHLVEASAACMWV